MPYPDQFGLGMKMSACLPVFKHNTHFKGVTCVDVLLRDLLGPMMDFPAQHMYSFMLDSSGRYVYHSLLPLSTYDRNPVYLQYEVLEHSHGVQVKHDFTATHTVHFGEALKF